MGVKGDDGRVRRRNQENIECGDGDSLESFNFVSGFQDRQDVDNIEAIIRYREYKFKT
jgi:hypothetical protein